MGLKNNLQEQLAMPMILIWFSLFVKGTQKSLNWGLLENGPIRWEGTVRGPNKQPDPD